MWLSMADLEQLRFPISHYFCWGYVLDHKPQSEILKYSEKEMQLKKKKQHTKNWKDDKHTIRNLFYTGTFFS